MIQPNESSADISHPSEGDGFAFEQIDGASDRVALVEGALAGTPIDGLFFSPLEAMKLGEALIAAAARSNGAAS